MVRIEPQDALPLVKQTAHPSGNEDISGHVRDGHVKLTVQPDHGFHVAAFENLLVFALYLTQLFKLFRIRPAGGQSGAQTVEQLNGVEIRGQDGDIERGDDRCAVAQRPDQTFRR